MSLYASTTIHSSDSMLIPPSQSLSCHLPVYSRPQHREMQIAYSMGLILYLWPLFVKESLLLQQGCRYFDILPLMPGMIAKEG